MRKRYLCFVTLLSLMLLPTMTFALPDGGKDIDGHAGAPPDNDFVCTHCHRSFALNSGPGKLSITEVPEQYTPGERYTLTINLSQTGQRRWGFEVTAIQPDLHGAGTFVLTDTVHTQLSRYRPFFQNYFQDYVKHTLAGTYNGTVNASPGWSVDWIAPPRGTKTMTFYGTGNAANGDAVGRSDGNLGDYIYTIVVASQEAPLPPLPGDFSSVTTPRDGVVNFTDFLLFARAFGTTSASLGWDVQFDLNGDNRVNFGDFLMFAAQFGKRV
ncbi:MAG: hypothetical protein HY709_10810, partial [Candidatus Latescibacteria bacterium]|nr:hypothetical protein [Candidatus Latescibacterota bacterium]